MVRVVEVADGHMPKVVPPSVLTSSCTAGVGTPLAVAVNVASCPAVAVWLAGCTVIAGCVGTACVNTTARTAVALVRNDESSW